MPMRITDKGKALDLAGGIIGEFRHAMILTTPAGAMVNRIGHVFGVRPPSDVLWRDAAEVPVAA